MLEIGGTVGRYRILRLLPRGIAGTSVLARDMSDDREVVLTEYAVDLDEGNVRTQFAGWADRLARVRHRHLAAIYGYGEHASRPYMVSEHAPGKPLSAALVREPEHALFERVAWMEAICAAIGHAHEQGIVHGGIAPSSIIVDDTGQLHILDVGILPMLRALDADAAGTAPLPGYAAPEVIRGGDLDASADVFALGAVCYELLAFFPPFGEGSAEAVSDRVLHADPAPLAGVDDDLASIVVRALDKDARARFPTAQVLGLALESWRARAGGAVPGATRPIRPPADRVIREVQPHVFDENVQFTVFRPNAIVPGAWHTMLVFAHLSERRLDASADEPDPVQEVQRQAEQLLGDPGAHARQTVDSLEAVPREGELTLVPRAEGVEFNPPARSFRWVESVHREAFRLRAAPAMRGGVVRGRLSVFLGSIVLAEIALTLKIAAATGPAEDHVVRETARPFRRIFASYSHLDHHIVDEFTEYARAIGDRYLRDVLDLRAGERWEPALERLIGQADVFQLFWSWNALASPHVRREWQFALGLQRPSFIRPVYWDEPMPSQGDLPPADLRALHFERIRPRRVHAPPPAAPGPSTTVSGPLPSGAQPPIATVPASRPAPRHLPADAPPRALWRRWPVLGPAMAAGLLLALAVPMWLATMGQDAAVPPADPPVSVGPEPVPSDTIGVDVTVRVRRATGAQPVAGAHVELVHARTGTTAAGTTDASGSVMLADLVPGDYRVSVSIEGRTALTRDVEVEGTEAIEVDVN